MHEKMVDCLSSVYGTDLCTVDVLRKTGAIKTIFDLICFSVKYFLN